MGLPPIQRGRVEAQSRETRDRGTFYETILFACSFFLHRQVAADQVAGVDAAAGFIDRNGKAAAFAEVLIPRLFSSFRRRLGSAALSGSCFFRRHFPLLSLRYSLQLIH